MPTATVERRTFRSSRPSDGDKATLNADRGADGTLKVVMRGDVYRRPRLHQIGDGRPAGDKASAEPRFRSRLKLGAVAGYNGEALRGVDLRMSRRNGVIRSFSLNAKLGRDTPLIGDMRTTRGNGRR